MQARLHEHLGKIKCELIISYNSSLIFDKTKLYSFNSIVSIIKIAFHERQNNNLFLKLMEYLSSINSNFNFRDYFSLELDILKENGYQLQLDKCALTGKKEELVYVSPRTGRAISREKGLPYHTKLLALPRFINDRNVDINKNDLTNASKLLTYFFSRYIWPNQNMPIPRKRFYEAIISLYN